jgi:hypothetical protein
MGKELGTSEIGEILRKEAVRRLLKILPRSTTADIERASKFLEWAIEIRAGCRNQRNAARKRQ